MGPPGGQKAPEAVIEMLARLPGYRNIDIARRLSMNKPRIDTALKTLRIQGRVERRKVTDPNHPNAGGFGYFLTGHHENPPQSHR